MYYISNVRFDKTNLKTNQAKIISNISSNCKFYIFYNLFDALITVTNRFWKILEMSEIIQQV